MVFDLNNNRTYWKISIEFGEVYTYIRINKIRVKYLG